MILLLTNIYGTWQAARKWHIHISAWMENKVYEAMNSTKTLFMKRKGSKYINHGLFVDDMTHTYSCDAMKVEFLALCNTDFEVTGGSQIAD